MANEKRFLVGLDLGLNKLINVQNGVNAKDAVNKSQLDAVVSGINWLENVKGIQNGSDLDPAVGLLTGDRYIITDTNNLHANFGTITGLEMNDVVEYDGSDWVVAYDVSENGAGAAVINQADHEMYVFDGVYWDFKSSDTTVGDNTSIDITDHVASVKDAGITADKLASNSVTSVKIAASAVTKEKIATDVAGLGLKKDTDGSLALADSFAANFGNGADTYFIFEHLLNTLDVMVQVYETSTGTSVECAVTRTNVNTVTVTVENTVPTNNEFRVLVKALY